LPLKYSEELRRVERVLSGAVSIEPLEVSRWLGKAAQKLLTGKSQGAGLVVMSVVPPAEGYLGRADREKAMVGNGDTMGITSEVMQDVFGPPNGGLA
jgi:hypothetical protein